MEFTDQEHATILAALRLWQRHIDPNDKPEVQRIFAKGRSPLHFEDDAPLTFAEIDNLCERLNAVY